MRNQTAIDKGPVFPGMTREAQAVEKVISKVYKVNPSECIFRDDAKQIDWKLRSAKGASFIFSLFRFAEDGGLCLCIDMCFLRTPREPTMEFRRWIDRENLRVSLPCRLVLFQENGQSLVTINSVFPWGMVTGNYLADLVDGMAGYSEMFIKKAKEKFDVATYYLPE